MGSFFGGGSAKRAAKEQAAAIRNQTRLNVLATNAATDANANQMAAAQAQRIASRYAEDLLSTPQERAEVNLATPVDDTTGDSRTTRRRGVRTTYQTQSGLNIL